MLRQLVIQIDCGEATCASEQGEVCNQLGSIYFGSTPVCMLFNEARLDIRNGWVQRCKECLNKVTPVVE